MAVVFYTGQAGPDAIAALNALWDLASGQFSSYSTTSLTIGTGSQSLTIEAGKALSAGQTVTLYNSANLNNWMTGTVTSYNAATGALVVNVTSVGGAGTLAAWTVLSPGNTRTALDLHGAATKATPVDADEFGFADSAASFFLKKLTFRNLISAISAAFGGVLTTGSGVSTGDASIELGGLRTGSGNAYIDLHATAGTDYDARLTRNSGANGALQLVNAGTGDLVLSGGGGNILLQPNGVTQFRVTPVASAVNYLQTYGAVTTGSPALEAVGTDANISVNFLAKGTGSHNLRTSGGGTPITQFQVAHTPNAVNYLQATGGAVGGAASLLAQGSDTNVSINYQSKGAGAHNFYAAGSLQFQITAVAAAVNYLQFNGSTSGNAVALSASGGDTNINLNLQGKGSGVVQAGGVQVATVNTVGALSFRNKVRNGRMDFAVRGTSFPAAAGYTLDGWRLDSGGSTTAVVTVSQAAGSLVSSEFQNYLKVQVTTADASVTTAKSVTLQQGVEGYLVRDLIGNPIAIRFEVMSPKAGQHYVALVNSGADKCYILPYTVAAANTAQLVTLQLPVGLVTAGTWNWTNLVGFWLKFPLLAGTSYQSATTGAWVTGNVFTGTGQQNLMDTVGNVFAITGVQLEKGNVSTAFEHTDIAVETTRNQRYLENIDAVFNSSPSTNSQTHSWRTEKRSATPTITATQISGTGMPTFSVTNGGRAVFQSTVPGGLGTAQITISAEL